MLTKPAEAVAVQKMPSLLPDGKNTGVAAGKALQEQLQITGSKTDPNCRIRLQ